MSFWNLQRQCFICLFLKFFQINFFLGSQIFREVNFPRKSYFLESHLSWEVTCPNLRHRATNDEPEKTTDRVKCSHRPDGFAAGINCFFCSVIIGQRVSCTSCTTPKKSPNLRLLTIFSCQKMWRLNWPRLLETCSQVVFGGSDTNHVFLLNPTMHAFELREIVRFVQTVSGEVNRVKGKLSWEMEARSSVFISRKSNVVAALALLLPTLFMPVLRFHLRPCSHYRSTSESILSGVAATV